MEPTDHGFTNFTTLHQFYARFYQPRNPSGRDAEKESYLYVPGIELGSSSL
jgi:hypothetical protein